MAGVIEVIATIFFILACFFLIFIVLLRKSETSGLGGSFGVGGDSPFGVKTQNALDRIAVYAAIAFFVLAIFLSLFPKIAGKPAKTGGGETAESSSGE